MFGSENNKTLLIRNTSNVADTGAYKCVAVNSAGASQDIATVFVARSDVPVYAQRKEFFSLSLTIFVYHCLSLSNSYAIYRISE